MIQSEQILLHYLSYILDPYHIKDIYHENLKFMKCKSMKMNSETSEPKLNKFKILSGNLQFFLSLDK